MNTPIDVIASGNLCLDLIPQIEHIPLSALASPGKLFEAGQLTISTGGSVSNTGLALHKLGVNVRLMAAVGDDLIGKLIINTLENRNSSLKELISVREGQASSYTVVLSPERADRIFLHSTGTNGTFDSQTVRYELLNNARMFHLGYPTLLPRLYAGDGEELVKIMRQASEQGVVTSLDLSLPDVLSASGQADWQSILIRTLPYTDIFIPSIEEILFMLRRTDYEQWHGHILENVNARYLSALADDLISMGVAVAGFKLGEMGLFIKTASTPRISELISVGIDVAPWSDVTLYQPAFTVDVAGTTGAGDATYAGFLAAMLRGKSPAETACLACAVGACCVEAADATSGVQSWDNTAARLDNGWITLDTVLAD